MQQEFAFKVIDSAQPREFLESLRGSATLEKRADDFYLFTALPGDPAFSFDVEIVATGFKSVRSGAYFQFLGLFVEAVTGEYGPVTISDT